MRSASRRHWARLVALGLVALSASARDLDLDIFPSAEPEHVAPTQPARPRESASRPALPEKSSERPAAPVRGTEDRLKQARKAAALFTLPITELAVLKQQHGSSINCFPELCVTTKWVSILGFRGQSICGYDAMASFKNNRITGASCKIPLATANTVYAAMKDLLGEPAKEENLVFNMKSTKLSWRTEARTVDLIHWTGLNAFGAPLDNWHIHVEVP